MVLMGYWESLIVRLSGPASWDAGHISSKMRNFPATLAPDNNPAKFRLPWSASSHRPRRRAISRGPRIKPPQEIAPNASAERAPIGKMHNFLGTPGNHP